MNILSENVTIDIARAVSNQISIMLLQINQMPTLILRPIDTLFITQKKTANPNLKIKKRNRMVSVKPSEFIDRINTNLFLLPDTINELIRQLGIVSRLLLQDLLDIVNR